MADIMIGTIVRSVKNGTTATVTSIDKKYKTALIEFDDGTARSYSLSTLKDKRQYVIVTNDDTVESAQKEESEGLETTEEETKEEVKPLIDLDNPITDEEATANGMVTSDEALEQAVVDPDAAYVAEQSKQEVSKRDEDIAGDGTPLVEVGKEITEQSKKVYDDDLMSKFVKKAQKIITSATHDQSGYHVTIVYNNKTKSFDDKNLQNIRSAIGHIYRGEVAV